MNPELIGCLAHLATSSESAQREWGRTVDCDLEYPIDPFALDEAKLLASKAIPALTNKTQVHIAQFGPFVRTRMRHTLEVVALATKIAELLGLNVALSRAIALGHDIGHLPFGHTGEWALSRICGYAVTHASVGVAIARWVERKGRGLNLTRQTLEGIRDHSIGDDELEAILPEGRVVYYADKFAYTFADVNDLLRVLDPKTEGGLIGELFSRSRWFGEDQRHRELKCVSALLEESFIAEKICFKFSDVAREFAELRRFMFDNAYGPLQVGRQDLLNPLHTIYDLLSGCAGFEGCDPRMMLALLTDGEARRLIDMSLDVRRISLTDLAPFGVAEIYSHICDTKFNLEDPLEGWRVSVEGV